VAVTGITLARVLTNFLDILALSLVALVMAVALGNTVSLPVLGPSINIGEENLTALFALTAFAFIFKSLIGLGLSRFAYWFLARIEVSATGRIVGEIFGGNLGRLKVRSRSEVEWLILRSTNIAFTSILGKAMEFVAELSLALTVLLAFFLTDWRAAISLLLLFSLLLIAFHLLTRAILSNKGKEFAEGSVSVGQAVGDMFSAFREISVSERKFFFAERIRVARSSVANAQATQQFMADIPRAIVELGLIFGAAGFIAVEYFRAQGDPDFVILAVFLVGSLRIMSALLPIQRSSSALKYLKPQAADAQALLLGSLSSPIGPDPETAKTLPKRGVKIELDNVRFSYSDSEVDKPTLRDISLTVEAGAFVAIIGPSGAGKSTLVDILIGLTEPSSGKVFYDDLGIKTYRELNPRVVGYVPQKPTLTHDSIRQNVAIGVPEEEIDDELVWNSLEKASLVDFVSQLPQGINSNLGKNMESLSGGQLQRIGLARALYLEPQLLVLDEATSGLDADTEATISNSLMKLKDSTTLIVVAHRLSTIQDADRVYVIDEGKVAASGTFATLRDSSDLVSRYVKLMSFDR
jgi:ATP-binding cassette subfamily C protein